MESLTKYRQSKEVIERMVQKYFPGNGLEKYIELTEGYFNVAYEVKLENGKELILKIAPRQDMRVMTYEKNIMYSEVNAMKLAQEKGEIPVPKVLGYDASCTICESPYFFMEKVDGRSMNSIRSNLTERQIETIYEEVGKIDATINQIVCPCFGYPGQKELQGKDWYSAFKTMLEAEVEDARRGNVDLKISVEQMWKALKKDQHIFKEVTEPRLVHWDCWDGNIFVKNGRVSGIIDWERCIWGDSLMEVGFRSYDQNLSFQKGYGITTFTESQRRRILWYDVYLLIEMSLECEYRHYDSMEMYDWATGQLVEQMRKITK